ncbi:MAG TPA: NIPSNAP family protein [Steroidobacter sp.]|uniref:NIPSNAP family protein n=1 Tax=Steroidobacter sp. TaxID=1978227 RepID=UPI002EDA261E
MKRLVEIRSYKLKPGATAAFHEAFDKRAVPLLREWQTDVVAFGPSAHESDTYFLIRAYDDLNDLRTRQDAFYGSDAWRRGPREAILSLIENYMNTVLWLSPAAIEDLRQSTQP